jgi:23S rRNA (uracil1939-C5)-methyltransferase
MRTGETAHLSVDSLTLDGEGVGQHEEHELLCRGAFPGEQVDVRIEAVSRHHPRAHARLQRVARPHPARRTAPCPNHAGRAGRCTGCPLMELGEEAQRAAKQQMLRARFGLVVDRVIAAPAALGYRASSKRVVFAGRRAPYLGSYVQGGHAPAAMPDCLVDHPLLVRAFAAVEAGLRATGVVPYDERSGTGDLRYVWAKTNGREVIVTLVSAHAHPAVQALVPSLSEVCVGVLHSVQPSRGNALRGGPATLLWGAREVVIQLLSQAVEVGALGFLQPNPEVAEQAYRALIAPLAPDAPRALAFDLYAGAGVTTRALRETFREVIASEAHPESARALGIEAEPVEPFLARALAAPQRVPDLVVANPPRKGLGLEVCRLLAALGPRALHVMSCGPEGLARDLAALQARFTLVSLEAFDTLPQTPHVELVAKLTAR